MLCGDFSCTGITGLTFIVKLPARRANYQTPILAFVLILSVIEFHLNFYVN